MSKAAKLLLGIDIGGTKLHAVVADETGRIRARARQKVGADSSFAAVMKRLRKLARSACREAGVKLGDIVAVGAGVPSPVLPDGTAVNAPNLGWQQAPVGRALSKLLGKPCVALNDCDAGTYGEHVFGAARGAETAVGLFMGTGLGGGIVSAGRLICGDNHQAAEVGHMVVVKDGRQCGCGHRGCLEAYASKTGMLRRITQEIARGRPTVLADPESGAVQLRSSALAQAYKLGDPVAVEALHEAADYCGVGVGNLITLLGPSVVVLGGGVMEALGRKLLARVRRAAAEVAWPPSSFGDTAIELATLGDDAVALGAVAWAARRQSTNRR